MIKGRDDMVVDWIQRLCNMVFESGVLPEDYRCAVIAPLHKGKGENTECEGYRGITLLSLVVKLCRNISRQSLKSD